MKKIILLFFILFPMFGLRAQDESGGPNSRNLFFGIKGGYGIVNFSSSVKGLDKFAERTYNNYSAGIIAGYNLSTKLSFQTEGNFARYGARNINASYIYSPQSPVLQPLNSNTMLDRMDMELYNVDVPLLIQYSPKNFGLTPYIYGGVNMGINVHSSSTIVLKLTDSNSYREYRDDITPRIIYNEFAPIVGMGLKKNSLKMVYFVDLRLKYGIKNLSNVDNSLGFTNRALWLSAGVIYNL